MGREPGLIALVGVEVVEDDMDFLVGIEGDDLIHEGEELDAPAALLVRGGDLAGGDIEGGEEGGGAVPLVIVAMAAERPSVGQLQIASARSSAWIDGFSSMHRTTAFCGGAK